MCEPHVSLGLGAAGQTEETGAKPNPAVARLKVSHSFSCSGWSYFSPLGISDLGGFYQNIKSIKCSIWEPVLKMEKNSDSRSWSPASLGPGSSGV